MRLEKQATFWLAGLLTLIALLWLLSGVLMPFAAGLVLAYLLDPLADRLERWGINRMLATTLIIGLALLLFIVLILAVVPMLATQFAHFVDKLPGYVSRLQALASEQGSMLAKKFGFDILDKLGLGKGDPAAANKAISGVIEKGGAWVGSIASSLLSGGQALLGVVSLLVVTPVVAFYMLVDWDRMVTTVDGWIPLSQRETVRSLARDIDAAIAGFIRGQTMVCLFLGLWYGIGLWLIGLNFGFLIGIVAGFLSFIPYVGSLTALVLSAGVAIVQGWPSFWLLIASMVVVGIGQFLEGNFLTPRWVGKSVGLHPVWLMFALIAFGSLFGFTGLIVAVPVAATIGVLLRFGLSRYLDSPLYRGTGKPLPGDVTSPDAELPPAGAGEEAVAGAG
ncbi:MAG: AI-2E family transporter, partial [Hyphomicrobiales bacterium]|nr:AI-2E family transporter [Hyphomicrobiales bacterium]